MTSIQPLKLGQMAHINCIEKFVYAENRGEHVAKKARVWKNINKTGRDGVVALAEHGEEVKILDILRDRRKVLHYKIQVQTDDGPVKGFVMFPCIDEAVDAEIGYGYEDIG